MNRLPFIAVALAVLVAGCASKRIVTGTGEGALDAYLKSGMTRGQAVPLAKRAATLAAQRDLIERYAGTFLSSQTQIDDFVTKSDRIISTARGLVKGVRVVRVEPSPDQTMYRVVVEARESDLRETLGDKPEPNPAPLIAPIVWPSEIGETPRLPNDGLRIDPKLRTISAKGVGVIPGGLDPRIARLRATRAAKAVALRNLAERVHGIRLSSNTTVSDYVIEQDVIRTKLDTVIKGARVVDTVEKDEGLIEVEMAVDVPEIEAALGLR